MVSKTRHSPTITGHAYSMILSKTCGFFCSLFLANFSALPAAAGNLTAAEIETMLHERIDQDQMGVGIVVGMVDEHGATIVSHGKMKKGGTQEVNGDTLFEIGSITKVFTALLLQDMAEQGEVKLEDPIGKYLPASVKTPSYHGREITLVDLATRTAGLPAVPFSFWHALWHAKDPYAGFKEKELYEFLSHYKPHEEIGAKFDYSNLGMELLGQVLSLQARTNLRISGAQTDLRTIANEQHPRHPLARATGPLRHRLR